MANRTIYNTELIGEPTKAGALVDTGLMAATSAINPLLGMTYGVGSSIFKSIQDAIQRKKAKERGSVITEHTSDANINIYGGRERGQGSIFDTIQEITTFEDVNNNTGIASGIASAGANALNMFASDDGYNEAKDEIGGFLETLKPDREKQSIDINTTPTNDLIKPGVDLYANRIDPESKRAIDEATSIYKPLRISTGSRMPTTDNINYPENENIYGLPNSGLDKVVTPDLGINDIIPLLQLNSSKSVRDIENSIMNPFKTY